MSKYIIEIAEEYEEYFKGVLICGIADGKFAVDVIAREDLEELNSDYINENFGELQDEAYQRGFEDGRWKAEDGCTGCKYEGNTGEHLPCEYCMNNFKNQWTAKQTDHIEVGDEVISDTGTKFIVTAFTTSDSVCGFSERGLGCFNTIDKLKKTGKHYDIAPILEAMRT